MEIKKGVVERLLAQGGKLAEVDRYIITKRDKESEQKDCELSIYNKDSLELIGRMHSHVEHQLYYQNNVNMDYGIVVLFGHPNIEIGEAGWATNQYMFWKTESGIDWTFRDYFIGKYERVHSGIDISIAVPCSDEKQTIMEMSVEGENTLILERCEIIDGRGRIVSKEVIEADKESRFAWASNDKGIYLMQYNHNARKYPNEMYWARRIANRVEENRYLILGRPKIITVAEELRLAAACKHLVDPSWYTEIIFI
jgi:hypothetical protein